jgi:hypothetical protein
MCDYSLFAHPNRLAHEGEQLEVYRFSSMSIGLASPAEIQERQQRKSREPQSRLSWRALLAWLNPPEPEEAVCAVCIPPGARLLIRDIRKDLQREFCVGELEEVTFVELGLDEHRYRDAVRFANGRELLLQRLREGQRVDVLSLGGAAAEPRTAEHRLESVFE